MKDKRLEERFDRYCDGVNPSYNTLSAAKERMERKKRSKKIFWGALVPSLCAVVICALFFTFIGGGKTPPADKDFNVGVEAPADDNSLSAGDRYYGDSALTSFSLSADSLSGKEMLFVKKFASARNATVNSIQGYSLEEDTVLYKTDLSMSGNGIRYDATVYVEYGDKVYEPLKDYSEGDSYYYKGYKYNLTETYENGEYRSDAYFTYANCKYYLSIRSSDKNAIRKYIDIITAQN